jgi:acetate kinase
MNILTCNAGSSSLRLALFERQDGALVRLRQAHHEAVEPGDPAPLARLLAELPGGIAAVAHRIVHGGRRHGSCRIDADVEREIGQYAPLAPLHNPAALRWLQACRRQVGEQIPQIAMFDTAFYADLPPVAATYPLPDEVCREHGLRRYGFHGIAHAAMWRHWCALHPELPRGGRVISLQLGAGCSATAIAQGHALDTSMGFTPLEGLMMATRSGDIDPGLLLHLQRHAGLSVEALEELLTRRSGLLGVSGASGDMRELLQSRDPRATLAVEMFCYRVRKYIGAYLAALGGADGVLFGGGIGQHSPQIRARILAGLGSLGIELDPQHNEQTVGAAECISAARSRIEVRVVPVDEDAVLAGEAEILLNTGLRTED